MEPDIRGGEERPLPIVCDLDGSLLLQPQIRDRIAARSVSAIDCRDIAPRLRLVASRSAAESLGERLAAVITKNLGVPIVFFGSGDFHHLTYVMLKSIKVPVTI